MTFDLDAWISDRFASSEPFTFTFGGEEYELPPQPDPRAAALFDTGQYGHSFALMLGPEQHRKFMASSAPLTRDAVIEVLRRHAAHAGASLGESSASSDSSENTGKRSRPTSNSSTDETSASSDAA